MVLPYPHLPNVVERWSFRDAATLARVIENLGGPVSPLLSTLVVLCYCAAALIGAGVLFQRRDITGGQS
jgi:hypothetical protein